ncbi:related to LAG1 - longevity-assurance protein [Pseudozyma flocculosa]|uniref:Related to LAG1 - longevity-assurance protein n=1 Tax=Pseudozyma flocculosa TaxID=84751 RepID=A0A5C3F124_9BASI|nr:related to LAG1 - longevity-assurance protein [Pseudozyma flocculosa]
MANASAAAKRRSKTEKAARSSHVDPVKPKAALAQHEARPLALSATRRAAEKNLDQQIPLVVMHMLSSPSSLSLAHLSTHLHLPQSLHSIIPSWLRSPSLAQFASDLPNASERGPHYLQQYAQNPAFGAAGPFRSDARGFGHPLTALHNFTRAALGLSYPVPDAKQSPIAALKHQAFETFGHGSWAKKQEPWAFMGTVEGYVYARGLKDVLIVATMVLVFTALRAILMKYILLPMGEHCVPAVQDGGKKAAAASGSSAVVSESRAVGKARRTRDKEVLRFAEQGFSLIYYVCSWSMGLYIASRESYWPMKTSEYWTHYPTATLDGLNKLYYLGELAFYIQQLFVLNVEARRSDHWQMFSHHVITIALIGGSYAYSFHRVGNAILCLMDPSDICLALAKMLKYSGLQTVCDAAFGIFMLSWLVTRHILYMVVMRSCIVEFSPHRVVLPTGDGGLEAPGSAPYWTLIGLLSGLQVILMIWFGMILRVLYRVLTKAGAVDSRSDDESSQEGEGEEGDENEATTKGQQEGSQGEVAAAVSAASSTPISGASAALAAAGQDATDEASATATATKTTRSKGRRRSSTANAKSRKA